MLNAVKGFVEGDADAKKDFAEALNKFVDFRVGAGIRDSQRNSIAPRVDSKSEMIALINALQSCPHPPKEGQDLSKWMIDFIDWYENHRLLALTCHVEEIPGQ
jgi:hypothetical protein